MKTNEIITGLRKLCGQGSEYRRTVCRLAADLLEHQQKRIEELEAERRWISVTERLPEDSCYCLCYWSGHRKICKFWRMYKHFEFNGRPVQVTHWMPLPSAEGLE